MEIVQADADRVVGRLVLGPQHSNGHNRVHGGAIMSLADTLGAIGTVLNLPRGSVTTTIESKTNFLRAVRDGAVTASTRPLHAGRTTIVIETELVRADGKLAAKVTQTQAFHYPRG